MTKRHVVLIFFLTAFYLPALCFGEQPIDVLQKNIEEGLNILRDPQYNESSRKKAQTARLWIVTREIFDFEEFSRRVLASYWPKFLPRQQKDFTAVFAEFLGKFYLRRVQARYNGETVFYLGQKLIGKSRALVDIKVLWKNLEVPVSVRMTNRSGTWKVYDLSALGISALSNYRSQFHWILKKQSPDQVIELLRAKLHHLEKEDQ